MLSPRMATSFLGRMISPQTKRYSPLVLVCHAVVAPELPLGAKPVRCLQEHEQDSCTNRIDRGDLSWQLRGVVRSPLGQRFSPHLLVQKQQRIEPLVVHFEAATHAGLGDSLKPFGAMARAYPC